MTQKSRRPAWVVPPAHLSANPPLPSATPQPQEKSAPLSPEAGGRDGPEPTRYGDWEVKGIAVDF